MNSEKKKYVLVIEYFEKEDRCEYIKEEHIYEDNTPSLTIGSVDLNDYFSELDIAGLTSYNIAKT